jgi:hypothetical protein
VVEHFLTHPYEYGGAMLLGAACGFGELFVKNKRVPTLVGRIVKRGSPARDVGLSFGCCLIYALAITIYVFSANDDKQYFLAAGAAIQTLANVIR